MALNGALPARAIKRLNLLPNPTQLIATASRRMCGLIVVGSTFALDKLKIDDPVGWRFQFTGVCWFIRSTVVSVDESLREVFGGPNFRCRDYLYMGIWSKSIVLAAIKAVMV